MVRLRWEMTWKVLKTDERDVLDVGSRGLGGEADGSCRSVSTDRRGQSETRAAPPEPAGRHKPSAVRTTD